MTKNIICLIMISIGFNNFLIAEKRNLDEHEIYHPRASCNQIIRDYLKSLTKFLFVTSIFTGAAIAGSQANIQLLSIPHHVRYNIHGNCLSDHQNMNGSCWSIVGQQWPHGMYSTQLFCPYSDEVRPHDILASPLADFIHAQRPGSYLCVKATPCKSQCDDGARQLKCKKRN